MLKRFLNRPYKVCTCGRCKDQIPVYENQSMTPAQMYEMMLQGKPLSSTFSDPSLFDDGDKAAGFEVPFQLRRGVEVTDVWEFTQDLKQRIFKNGSAHYKKLKQNSEGGE